ncbi:MAG TPA: hypothetical protein VFQ86_00855 [Arachidicoccus soli]|nr:hypothetical protein [Arachidicoccus soli]
MKYTICAIFLAITYYCQAQQKLAKLNFLSLHPTPIIGQNTKGAEDIKFGFEGGSAVKVKKHYYIFTTENFDEPKTAAVRLALWKSKDGIKFTRHYQLTQTNYNWNDSTTYLMSPWSPSLVFDSLNNRWSVFYVGYRRKPGSPNVYNMSGRIRRFDAVKKGEKGLEGPYKVGNWLNINQKGEDWEGAGELLSFYPYKVGKIWYGFLGTNTVPVVLDAKSLGGVTSAGKSYFRASLARADSLTGRWERVRELNPVMMDEEFIENSIVTKINDNLYINVYDGANKHELSYATSSDGIHWNKEQIMNIPNPPEWLHTIRTPLGLINEGNNIYTIYFTAFDGKNPKQILPLWHLGFGNVGMMKVKLVILE